MLPLSVVVVNGYTAHPSVDVIQCINCHNIIDNIQSVMIL
jgi:hypothetical protein